MGKKFEKILHKIRYENGRKTHEKCSTPFVTREMQIKATIRYTVIRMAKIRKTDNTRCYQGFGMIGTLTCS